MADSRTLLNIGLLALVAGLAALALWESGKAPAPEPAALTALDADAIRTIRIERSGLPTVAVERDAAGHWQLTEPLAVAANDFRIDSLTRVAEAKTQGGFPAEGDLSAYGLEPPQVRLTLDGLTTLEFGGSTPVDQRRYVRIGDRVHLIGDTHFYHLIGDVATFVSQRLLPEGARIERIALPGLELREQDGHWSTVPAEAAESADALATLVENWRLARAMEVRGAHDDATGETVRLTLADRTEPLTFAIARREPDTVLVRPDLGLAYRLPPAVADGLFSLPADAE